jgi:hypothetical protein
MSGAASNFRRTDVKRAVQAVESAGVKIERIELEKGKIVIFPNNNGAGTNGEPAKE